MSAAAEIPALPPCYAADVSAVPLLPCFDAFAIRDFRHYDAEILPTFDAFIAASRHTISMSARR